MEMVRIGIDSQAIVRSFFYFFVSRTDGHHLLHLAEMRVRILHAE
jgi:hypothetical protein